MAKHTLVLDSSQISSFLECKQYWNLRYQKKLILSAAAHAQSSQPMNAGTYGHKLLDLYYRNRVNNISFNESIARAFAYDPDTDTCVCGCGLESHKFLTQLNVTECQRCKKCLKFTAKPFDLDKSTRIAVMNRLREYFAVYQMNDFQPLSEQHIEVGFSEPVYEDKENLFVLEGRIDIVGKLQGLTAIIDHKFQMRKHDLYRKSIQFRNYCLIAKIPMMIINYIRLSKTVDATTLVREPVSFNAQEMLHWREKLISIFFQIKEAQLRAGADGTFEQNFSSCPGRFNYECAYTQLCEEPNKDILKLKTNQLYTINPNPWRPW